MTKYEILLLLDPGLDDGRQAEIVGRARELVETGEGSWDLHDVWGRRRLAYEIDHKAEGSYHLLHFTSEAGTLDEISRVLRIDDGVLRHLATRRIEGSPARPVAPAAPARQDSEAGEAAGESAPTGSENGASGADDSDSGAGASERAPETATEVEEEE